MATSQRKKSNRTSRNKVNKTRSFLAPHLLLRQKYVGIFALIVGIIGVYLLVLSFAMPRDNGRSLVDNPGKGQIYHNEKHASTGPCKGVIETDHKNEHGHHACTHADSGPEGIDVRERDKLVDAQLAELAEKDRRNPPKDEPSMEEIMPDSAANVTAYGSLGSQPAVNWPCVGTGSDGYRVQMIYAYINGKSNRLSNLRPGFNAIAKRTNGVFYYSGVATGGARKVRFVTNSSCALDINTVTLSASGINDFNNVVTQLKSKGLTRVDRKYMVQVDGGTACGRGTVYNDAKPTQDNYNNKGPSFAIAWHPCWNYIEPHELMHTMGAVIPSAPYATPGYHCYDQNDVMCYQDNSGKSMQVLCSSSTALWRFDCNSNTYFRSAGAYGWLANNWNTANNRFLQQ